MGFIEWAEKMRKKPIEERRQFVAVASVATMAAVALVWFIFFFVGLKDAVSSVPQVKFSFPELPALDPNIEKGLEKFGF